MDTQVMHEMSVRSLDGTITFPEVVANLMRIGVESYDVDLVRGEKTFYMPDGRSHREALDFRGPAAAREFSAEGVVAAIRASQRGEIRYAEFLERILKAGTTRYSVYLDGRKAVYCGRKGDFHVELFPSK